MNKLADSIGLDSFFFFLFFYVFLKKTSITML